MYKPGENPSQDEKANPTSPQALAASEPKVVEIDDFVQTDKEQSE